MRRTTPGRYTASLDSRPPFTTSTQVGLTRSTTPPSSATPSRRYVSPSTRQRQAQHPAGAALMPARFGFGGSGSGGGSQSRSFGEHPRASPPGGDETISAMLTDLVSLSHSIERYIAENPNAVAGVNSVPRSLRADEIERVVRRVEEHFKGKIEELERRIDEQKDVIVQLSRERDQWRRRASSDGGERGPVNQAEAVRGSIASRSVALNDLERAWAAETEHSEAQGATPKSIREHGELQQLRQILLEEKRQRLLVEEQTQSLTEQHSKVVNTLEQRIRKQEKQLQLIMDAFEQHQSSVQQNAAAGTAAGAASLPDDGVRGTPRSIKFRQRSSRHGGEEYGAAHAPQAPPQQHGPPTPEGRSGQNSSRLSGFSKLGAASVFADRSASADITDVIELYSGVAVPRSAGPTVPRLPLETSVPSLAVGGAGVAAPSLSSDVKFNDPALPPEAAMDDVAAFLANISKELESISDVEGQRQTRLAALS